MNKSPFEHKLAPETVLKKIEPLKDKEPTPAWRKMLNDILKEFHVSMRLVIDLATKSNRRNELGRHYGKHSFSNVLQHYKERDNGWTENAQKTVNDHLDILADYLIDPELGAKVPEEVTFVAEAPVLSLKERLEKERAEGKWPSVDEKMALHFHRTDSEPYSKVKEVEATDKSVIIKASGAYPPNVIRAMAGLEPLEEPTHCVKVKPRKIRKKHKKHHARKIVIYI
jgi:hypothetical protein